MVFPRLGAALSLLFSQAPSQAFGFPAASAAVTHVASTVTYPTTVTSIWSTTSSATISPDGAWPVFHRQVYITTLTVTTLEPWSSSPTSFPHTLVQTAITHRTMTTEITPCVACGTAPLTTIATAVQTSQSTWLLYAPAPTDLPRDATLPCAECAGPAFRTDPRCQALGLDTACQAQCDLRGGLWWCFRREYADRGPLQMGRACWGKGEEYLQLVTPCAVGDHAFACTPCNGTDITYWPLKWHEAE
jgi:hypothetical protein